MHSATRHCASHASAAAAVLMALSLLAPSAGWAASKPKPAKPQAPTQTPIFYPPPPEQPRLQFLASYSSEDDLRPKKSKFTTFIVGKAPPAKSMAKPYGLAFHHGNLYVCDSSAAVIHVFDFAKRRVRRFSPSGTAQLRTPINVTFDQDGTWYVADTGRGQVLKFGPNAEYLGALGEKGEMRATDVAISRDRLYVTNLKDHNVRVYAKADLGLLFTIPRRTNDEPSRLFMPVNLAFDSKGQLYVSDLGANMVKQYDSEGNYLKSFGKHGDAPGEFARPKGLAVDREDRLYVVDAAAQVVQIFDAEGRLLLFLGEPTANDPAALNLPAKVLIDYDHVSLFQSLAAPGFKLEYLVLVSNQLGDRKVNVYGFGRKQ